VLTGEDGSIQPLPFPADPGGENNAAAFLAVVEGDVVVVVIILALSTIDEDDGAMKDETFRTIMHQRQHVKIRIVLNGIMALIPSVRSVE
jgi:hypothetical protein